MTAIVAQPEKWKKVTSKLEQVCVPKFMKEFTAACRAMKPLVEFSTKALGVEVLTSKTSRRLHDEVIYEQ